jgi:uncharacterized protein
MDDKRINFGNSSYIDKKQILALVGLRRVGKTTLLKQIIFDLLKNINPKQIMFFSFEHKSSNKDLLEELIYYFIEDNNKKEKIYIFLDEIQNIEGFEDVLKKFYDRELNIKFIISGSSSIKINKSKESLAGRIYDFYIPYLTFKEYLEMKKMKIDKFNLNSFKKNYESLLFYKEKIEKYFLEYLYKGAFPELVNEDDEEIIRRYINNSVVERIIFKDIPDIFNIRNKEALEKILEFICSKTSNIISFEKLSEVSNINQETVSEYVNYLKLSFIIKLSFNYSKNKSKQMRKNKKMYIVHPCIAISKEFYGKEIFNMPEIMGKYVETLVANNSNAKFFWNENQIEVDVINIDKNFIYPMEVKYRNNITNSDLKGLLNFMDQFKINKGFLITKNIFKTEIIDKKEIIFLPVWFYLLFDLSSNS